MSRWLAASLTAIGLVACGGATGFDARAERLEGVIHVRLAETGTTPEKVACPRGLTWQPGATFTCQASAPGGATATVDVEMLEGGEVDWKVRGGGPTTEDGR